MRMITDFYHKLIEAIDFFGKFLHNLTLVTFQPRTFVENFNRLNSVRTRITSAYLFLLCLVFALSLLIDVVDRAFDSWISLNDAGFSTIFQSSMQSGVSLELLIRNTVPLMLMLMGGAWLISRLCARDKSMRVLLRTIFPYVLWRSSVLIFVFVLLSTICAGVILFAISFIYRDIILWVLVGFPKLFVGLLIVITFFFTLWRVTLFVSRLRPLESNLKVARYRNFFFSFGVMSMLVIPVWWSSVALSPPARKVAVNQEKIEISLSDSSQDFILNLQVRNVSHTPLFLSEEANRLTWWDDTHPVYVRKFFSTDRVPNGRFSLRTSNHKELSDRFETVTYVGNVSKSILIARSYGAFDFMGGPEVEPPSEKEYHDTLASFEEILRGMKRGRIDVTFGVSTKGGRISERTVTIHKSN